MLDFLSQIKNLDPSSPPSAAQTRLEPRQVRRQKAKAAAQANQSLGAAAVQPSSKNKVSASSKDKRKAG